MPIETIMDNSSSEQTLTESGFYWRERGGVNVLVCRALEDAGFINAFSTRLGGVSPFPFGDLNLAGFDEDSEENIHENRRRFLAAVGSERSIATVWQVHGNGVKMVNSPENALRTDEKFDAVVSRLPEIFAGVQTADCVPVLVGDPVSGSYAAVHAGWRGTAASIVPAAIAKLADSFGAKPENFVCAIGPAATKDNYEIGQEVMDVFDAKYLTPTRPGHAMIDLHLANRDQCVSAGISEANIYTAPFCTMERTDLFFSYRKEKKKFGKTGRLLSVIGRR